MMDKKVKKSWIIALILHLSGERRKKLKKQKVLQKKEEKNYNFLKVK